MIGIKDCECQLLGAWILGYHRHHVKDFKQFAVYVDVFRAIAETEKFDIVTIANKSKCTASEIAAITSQYMPSLYDDAYKHVKQQQIRTMLEALKNSPDDVATQIDLINKEVEQLNNTEIKKPVDLSEMYKREIEKRKVTENIPYDLPKLNYITGGLREEELTVIAARPSIGKTALALQIAFKTAMKGKRVLFFPLEMSANQLVERLVCRDTTIIHEHLKAPLKLTKEENADLNHWLGLFKKHASKLMVIENVSYLSDIDKYIAHYKPDLVIIDQLSQLKEYKNFGSIRERFTYMTNTSKALTMKHKKPIILLAQINRDAQNQVPTLAHLKESGTIEEDADTVIMLHQKGEMSNDYRTPMEIIVRKQRNGQRDVFIDSTYLNTKFAFIEVM